MWILLFSIVCQMMLMTLWVSNVRCAVTNVSITTCIHNIWVSIMCFDIYIMFHLKTGACFLMGKKQQKDSPLLLQLWHLFSFLWYSPPVLCSRPIFSPPLPPPIILSFYRNLAEAERSSKPTSFFLLISVTYRLCCHFKTTSLLYLRSVPSSAHFRLSPHLHILPSNCLQRLWNASACATPGHACHSHSFFSLLCIAPLHML